MGPASTHDTTAAIVVADHNLKPWLGVHLVLACVLQGKIQINKQVGQVAQVVLYCISIFAFLI